MKNTKWEIESIGTPNRMKVLYDKRKLNYLLN